VLSNWDYTALVEAMSNKQGAALYTMKVSSAKDCGQFGYTLKPA
jgi:hypothetical protein